VHMRIFVHSTSFSKNMFDITVRLTFSIKVETYNVLRCYILNKRPKRRNMDLRFGLWNVRSLYRAGSLMSFERTVKI
jgi:hypothetical protein